MSAWQAPSMALLRAFSPRWCAGRSPVPCIAQQQLAQFSTTEQRQKRQGGVRTDPRIVRIRYHLQHPITPRPLRFSRTRSLRHWTIHRAWQFYSSKQRQARQLELERQYNSMAAACEALRNLDAYGLTADERQKLGQTLDGGKSAEGVLYRTAMMKDRIWKGVPIEYARIQTESPAREGWNHGWTR